MPMYEIACSNELCENYSHVEEKYYSRYSSPDPDCLKCGCTVRRLISVANFPFLGAITAKYNNPKLDGAHLDGHWAWRRKSAQDFDQPEPVWIDTWQKRKEFMKAEGLAGFEDTGDRRAGSGGKLLSEAGMPGCWTLPAAPPEAETQSRYGYNQKGVNPDVAVTSTRCD